MSRQHWKKKVRLLDLSGRSSYITETKAQKLIDAGDAEVLYEVPLTIRTIDKVGYKEDLRRETGRVVKVSKGAALYQYDIDPSAQERLKQPATARRDTRCKAPRHHIPQVEREFQRYKTRLLRNKSEEELSG